MDATGIEPVTPSMSTRCSPAELRIRRRSKVTFLGREGALYNPPSRWTARTISQILRTISRRQLHDTLGRALGEFAPCPISQAEIALSHPKSGVPQRIPDQRYPLPALDSE